MTDSKLPLGQKSGYPNKYAPDLLFPIPRRESREILGNGDLRCHGCDIWNAWELTWLGTGGRPSIATAEFRVPAESPNLIESKSLKLYLGSFAMSLFEAPAEVRDIIAKDLSDCAGAEVSVVLDFDSTVADFAGQCIDQLAIECSATDVDASLLEADADVVVTESLHTHLLRSLCPVTDQPDSGSLQITYTGPKINPESLLHYVVSFREHNDFHEACVERIFADVKQRCAPDKLSVYARYQRRGGIDINPFRSDFENSPQTLRLWRQ